MILQTLNRYYQRLLEADPECGIPRFGFSRQGISFCLVLNPDGTLHSIQDLREERDGRMVPLRLVVPHPGGKRTSGAKPYFLWDKTAYVLGRDVSEEEKDRQKAKNRLRGLFEAFKDLHLAMRQATESEEFEAVCQFLESWTPSRAEDLPHWSEVSGKNVVFRIQASDHYVHDLPEVKEVWLSSMQPARDAHLGTCLVSNRLGPIAKTHMPIKGIHDPGGQVEKSIVSFNLDAFKSYGKEQSLNAPVSELAAFQYATALNHLLADDRRRMRVGDATAVFWTDTPTPAEQVVPSLFVGGTYAKAAREDERTLDRLRAFLSRLREGRRDDLAEVLGDLQTPYYILGLSPNASRVSVRFWLTGTLGELGRNLARHVADLDVVGLDDRFPTLSDLLRETAPPKKGYPDPEKVPGYLSAGLARAVLAGQRYPPAFYSALCRRILCEQFVDRNRRNDWRRAMAVRAAAIKAILIRNYGKEIPVSLDPDRPEPAYRLGRWFALLEKIQRDALGEKINATIKDRFYTAASSTPASVFPRLIQLSQHHLSRIDKAGLRIKREKQVQEVACRLDGFPRRLALEDQGLFHLGYYHQTQALYTRRDDSEDTGTPEKESE